MASQAVYALSAIVAAAFTIVVVAPAHASHDGFHRYSIVEDAAAGITGLATTRHDQFAVTASDGCTGYYTGHPAYQTQWVLPSLAGSWIEIGTGHACSGTKRYHFWGYGVNGTWYPQGQRTATAGQAHRFRMQSNGDSVWRFYIDVTEVGYFPSSMTGTTVQAGLESYYANGSEPAYAINPLQLKQYSGSYVGSTSPTTFVDSGMCGLLVSSTQYNAGQGPGSSVC